MVSIKALVSLALIAAGLPSLARAADWQATEKIDYYTVSGSSGAELYAAIGEHGPKVALGTSAIAHTNFVLTWTRKYEVQGNDCAIVTAKPKLIITYTLPRAPKKLPAAVQANWDAFAAGVHKHELVHGEMIKDMVGKIQATSLGLRVENDRACKKIRTELTGRLGELSKSQRQQSRDFDQVELTEGGNVHQLILKLVNGP